MVRCDDSAIPSDFNRNVATIAAFDISRNYVGVLYVAGIDDFQSDTVTTGWFNVNGLAASDSHFSKPVLFAVFKFDCYLAQCVSAVITHLYAYSKMLASDNAREIKQDRHCEHYTETSFS